MPEQSNFTYHPNCYSRQYHSLVSGRSSMMLEAQCRALDKFDDCATLKDYNTFASQLKWVQHWFLLYDRCHLDKRFLRNFNFLAYLHLADEKDSLFNKFWFCINVEVRKLIHRYTKEALHQNKCVAYTNQTGDRPTMVDTGQEFFAGKSVDEVCAFLKGPSHRL